jgi:iron complex outermembrane receptor protein
VSLAAIRDLGRGYSLAFNAANAERMPVADELYANGPHLATGTVEIGDPNLGSETSRHFDLGLRKTEGDLTWAITAFVTDYVDYIYLAGTGTVDEDLPVFAFSQRDADFKGVEAELFVPIADFGDGHIDMRLFADYVEGELDTGEYLPRLPPRRAGARLQYHDDRLLTGLEVTRHDDQHKVASFEDPTPGYTMLNADLQWSIGGDREVRYDVFVRGTNLLNEDARRHTSFLKEIAPLPGRNYSIGFRTSF